MENYITSPTPTPPPEDFINYILSRRREKQVTVATTDYFQLFQNTQKSKNNNESKHQALSWLLFLLSNQLLDDSRSLIIYEESIKLLHNIFVCEYNEYDSISHYNSNNTLIKELIRVIFQLLHNNTQQQVHELIIEIACSFFQHFSKYKDYIQLITSILMNGLKDCSNSNNEQFRDNICLIISKSMRDIVIFCHQDHQSFIDIIRYGLEGQHQESGSADANDDPRTIQFKTLNCILVDRFPQSQYSDFRNRYARFIQNVITNIVSVIDLAIDHNQLALVNKSLPIVELVFKNHNFSSKEKLIKVFFNILETKRDKIDKKTIYSILDVFQGCLNSFRWDNLKDNLMKQLIQALIEQDNDDKVDIKEWSCKPIGNEKSYHYLDGNIISDNDEPWYSNGGEGGPQQEFSKILESFYILSSTYKNQQLDIISKSIQPSSPWKDKLVGLTIFKRIAKKSPLSSRIELLKPISNSLGDDNPRIRFVALQCLFEFIIKTDSRLPEIKFQIVDALTGIISKQNEQNERILAIYCQFLKSLIEFQRYTNIFAGNEELLLGTLNSFEILLLSPKGLFAKHAILALESMLSSQPYSPNNYLKGYYHKFIPSLISFLNGLMLTSSTHEESALNVNEDELNIFKIGIKCFYQSTLYVPYKVFEKYFYLLLQYPSSPASKKKKSNYLDYYSIILSSLELKLKIPSLYLPLLIYPVINLIKGEYGEVQTTNKIRYALNILTHYFPSNKSMYPYLKSLVEMVTYRIEMNNTFDTHYLNVLPVLPKLLEICIDKFGTKSPQTQDHLETFINILTTTYTLPEESSMTPYIINTILLVEIMGEYGLPLKHIELLVKFISIHLKKMFFGIIDNGKDEGSIQHRNDRNVNDHMVVTHLLKLLCEIFKRNKEQCIQVIESASTSNCDYNLIPRLCQQLLRPYRNQEICYSEKRYILYVLYFYNIYSSTQGKSSSFPMINTIIPKLITTLPNRIRHENFVNNLSYFIGQLADNPKSVPLDNAIHFQDLIIGSTFIGYNGICTMIYPLAAIGKIITKLQPIGHHSIFKENVSRWILKLDKAISNQSNGKRYTMDAYFDDHNDQTKSIIHSLCFIIEHYSDVWGNESKFQLVENLYEIIDYYLSLIDGDNQVHKFNSGVEKQYLIDSLKLISKSVQSNWSKLEPNIRLNIKTKCKRLENLV